MKKIVIMLGIFVLAISGVVPGAVLANGGFSIGPDKLAVNVPADGDSTVNVYVTSSVDGELIVGTENIPFRVEPGTIPISAADLQRRVELTVYGNPVVEAGEYSGKLTFRIRSDSNVSYGIKLKATITQVSPPAETTPTALTEEAEGKVAEVSLIETARDNLLVIILGALVLVLIAVLVGIIIGRRQRSGA